MMSEKVQVGRTSGLGVTAGLMATCGALLSLGYQWLLSEGIVILLVSKFSLASVITLGFSALAVAAAITQRRWPFTAAMAMMGSAVGVALPLWLVSRETFWLWLILPGGMLIAASIRTLIALIRYNKPTAKAELIPMLVLMALVGLLVTPWPWLVAEGMREVEREKLEEAALNESYALQHSVEKFDTNGTFVARWTDGGFEQPYGIAAGPTGSVYVTDRLRNHVQVFSSRGQVISTWIVEKAGAIAVDSTGNVYVSSVSANGAEVRVFRSDGAFIRKCCHSGDGDSQFYGIEQIAVDSAGNVYVVSSNIPERAPGRRRLHVFGNDGKSLAKWGDEAIGTVENFFPRGLAVDETGRVYSMDYSTGILVFDNDGTSLASWGKLWGLRTPHGIALDTSGNLYVADSDNQRVLVLDREGMLLREFTTKRPQHNRFSQAGDWLPGPRKIAVDDSGNVYVLYYGGSDPPSNPAP